MSTLRTACAACLVFAFSCAPAAEPYDTSPAWSLDGQYIYFYTYRHENAEIYRMKPDGSDQTRLTDTGFNEWWMHALPGGTELLVASDRDSGEPFGGSNLYRFDPEDGSMDNLTNLDEGQWAALADVAIEANVAIYSVSDEFGANADSELWILDLDSNESLPYPDDPAHHNIYPAISADGSVVAYLSNRDGQNGLYVNNLAGTAERRVLRISAPPSSIAISRDGSRVAMVLGAWVWGEGEEGGSAGDRDIYVATLDGKKIYRLTSSPASDHSPAWSPDGTAVTFTSYRHGPGDIFAVHPDGTNERNLTKTSPGAR